MTARLKCLVALVLALATASTLAVGAQPADAAVTVSTGAKLLHVLGDDADDDVQLRTNTADPSVVVIHAQGVEVARVPRSLFTTILIDTTGGADRISTAYVGGPLPDFGKVAFDGGSGDDVIEGGAAVEQLAGGEGNDTLRGGGGRDLVQGGGRNVPEGARDDDTIVWEPLDDRDEASGDGGTDTVKAIGTDTRDIFEVQRRPPLALSAATSALEPFNIEIFEADLEKLVRVQQVERVLIDGADGNDLLILGAGPMPPTEFMGGPGSGDAFDCGDGATVLDREPAETVTESCVFPPPPAPPADPEPPQPPTGDEPVPPAPPVDAPSEPAVLVPPGPKSAGRVSIGRARLRLDRRGRVGIRVRCPRAAAIPCAGRLVLRHGRSTAGSNRFSIAPGRSATVRVKLTRRARAALRRSGRLRLTATAGDARRTLRVVR